MKSKEYNFAAKFKAIVPCLVFFSCGRFSGRKFGGQMCDHGNSTVPWKKVSLIETAHQWKDCQEACEVATSLYGKGCCQATVRSPNEYEVIYCNYFVGARVIDGPQSSTKVIDCRTSKCILY